MLDGFPRYLSRELLREVRLSPRPVINAIERRSGLVRLEIQFGREKIEFLARKVIQRDLLGHVERRQLRLADKADRVALAQEHESQAGEIRVRRARIMRSANAREELVCGRHVLDALYLVHEHDDALAHELQDDFGIELQQALAIAQHRAVVPPRLQVITDAQLSQQAVGDVVVPAAGVAATVANAYLFEIEHGNFLLVCFEPRRRRSNQARFTAARRRQHMGIAS